MRNTSTSFGPAQPQMVEETFVRVSPLLNLHVGGRVIRVTGEHPLYLAGRGWLAAGFLEVGDLLVTLDGNNLPVETVTNAGEVATVYYFRVTEYPRANAHQRLFRARTSARKSVL